MTDSIPCSFHTLHRHSIFQPSPGKSSPDTPASTEDDIAPLKKHRLVMRDKEIIVAIGREIRLASLSGDGFEVRNEQIGRYSILVSPSLSFNILSLALNPTGRLLAVIGRTQVVVLALPRPGSVGRGEVACRSIVIDAPQFSAESTTAIAKVLWHPLGQNGESLWILTSDGQLREYDIQSPYDPIQTFALVSAPPPSSSRFSAADPLSRVATSFTFGSPSRAGWGELAVYGLLANGDLYTLCPVIPFRTEVPLKYIQRLKAYVGEKGTEEEVFWVDNLARQIKLEDPKPGSPEPLRNVKLSVLGRSAIVRQTEKEIPVDGEKMVRLHPTHLTEAGGPAPGDHMQLERQGPAVFEGVEPDEEDRAADLVLLSVGVEGKGKAKGGEVRVMAVAWGSGRVDVGVEVERVQGRWVGSSGSKAKSPAVTTIPIIESIQLDVPAHLAEQNSPSFTTDPLHPDTVYIQHIAGVDAISVLGAASATISGQRDIPACDVAQLVSTSSTKPQPIEGIVTCYNFSLGYGALALSPINRLAAIELDYRSSDKADSPPIPTSQTATTPPNETDTSSLLIPNSINIEHLLTSLQPSSSLTSARSALRSLSTANRPLSTIGAEHLRAIGDLIANLQSRIEVLRTASQTIERHLDLQTKEFQRQLSLLGTTAADLESVKSHNAVGRAEGMMVEQGKLAGRMDKVLSGLTGMYRPPLGEVEKGWFEELEGVRRRVEGGRGFGVNSGGGLKGQVEELEHELDAVRPAVESVNKELSVAKKPQPKVGAKQIRPLESALYQKMDDIGRLMRKMEGLKVEVEEVLDGGAAKGSPHKA